MKNQFMKALPVALILAAATTVFNSCARDDDPADGDIRIGVEPADTMQRQTVNFSIGGDTEMVPFSESISEIPKSEQTKKLKILK